MVGTLQTVGLLLLAVVPGALLVFSYERRAGALAGDSNERTIRFVVGTALVFPYAATLAALTYAHVVHVPVADASGSSFRNRLAEPTDLSPWWTLVPLAYVLVPSAVGWVLGQAHVALRRRTVKSGSTSLVPGLTAWEIMFLRPGPKLITVKLRSGQWVAGIFADGSFASAPAAKEKQLVLEDRVQVNEGGVIERDEDDTPTVLPGTVVVSYADVELMFVEQT